MNRFHRQDRQLHIWKSLLPPILAFILILLLFTSGLSSVTKASSEEQKKSLETALNKSIVHCYAYEGSYPPSLKYIEDHYGLTYDTGKFYIDYQPVASNIMPDITIITLEEQP